MKATLSTDIPSATSERNTELADEAHTTRSPQVTATGVLTSEGQKTHFCYLEEHPINLDQNLPPFVPNHAAINRARTRNFFAEIKDLLVIDNAYRGMLGVNCLVEASGKGCKTTSSDIMRVFFHELTVLVKADNSYRGLNDERKEFEEKCSA